MGRPCYNNQAVHAAIAQSVERILGKDEVASSNLASSSTFFARIVMVLAIFAIFQNIFDIFKKQRIRRNIEQSIEIEKFSALESIKIPPELLRAGRALFTLLLIVFAIRVNREPFRYLHWKGRIR